MVNGGLFVGGELPNREPLDARDGLSLLLRGGHLLLVPARDGEVHSAANVREIDKILVDGEVYRPVYVSEAKDPPVREEHVDQNAASELELAFEDGKRWRFRYVGAFHKHLAETAAHAIHSVREIARNPQASGSARSFPILRP